MSLRKGHWYKEMVNYIEKIIGIKMKRMYFVDHKTE